MKGAAESVQLGVAPVVHNQICSLPPRRASREVADVGDANGQWARLATAQGVASAYRERRCIARCLEPGDTPPCGQPLG